MFWTVIQPHETKVFLSSLVDNGKMPFLPVANTFSQASYIWLRCDTGRSDREEAILGQASGQHHRIDIQMLFPGLGLLIERIQPESLDIFD